MEEQLLRVWQLRHGFPPLPMELADVSLDAVSRRLPQGFYTTFRTFGNCTCVLDLKHHLARLYAPAAAQGLQPAVDEDELRLSLRELLAGYRSLDEARVRLSLSAQEAPGSLVVAIEPLKRLPDEVYRDGVRVVTTAAFRADPRLKSTAFIAQSDRERQAVAQGGAFEGLIVLRGRILEGLTSNFFYVRGAALGTAQRGILLGVTRRLVLRLARQASLRIEYHALRVATIGSISEAFISSSSRGIVPVVAVDGQQVGSGRPGALTQDLMRRYLDYVTRRTDLI